MSVLICPVCGAPLERRSGNFDCAARHSFDIAREGYCNLLPVNRHRSRYPGDAPELVRARRAFLDADYYAPLRSALAAHIPGGVVLDACCGEGYYTAALAESADAMYGFDIAKDAVRLAAKRDKRTQYFVAGLHAIPVQSGSIDLLTHVFAPFAEAEFTRILKGGGTLVHVMPGAEHLMGLKRALYDAPRPGRETPPATALTLEKTERLRYSVKLCSNADIRNLFSMTPYSYKTSREASQRLETLDTLETTLDFVILTYRK